MSGADEVSEFGGPDGSPFGDPDDQPGPGAGARRDVPGPSVSLRDELVVLTGATGLLGAAVASELARHGARICLLGRDQRDLEAVVAGLPPTASTAVLRCDLVSAEDVVAAAGFVERLDAPVRLLVHAAGLQQPSRLSDGTVEQLDEHYLVNLRGPYLLTQRLIPLVARRRGTVVFVTADPESSGATAHRSGPGASASAAHSVVTEAGVRAMAEQLRAETASSGVRVLAATTSELGPEGAEALARTLVRAVAESSVEVVGLHARPRK